jgi:hypothetical protein
MNFSFFGGSIKQKFLDRNLDDVRHGDAGNDKSRKKDE